MGDAAIQVGDRVIILQMPGVFRVASRTGRMIIIESARGVRLTVQAEAVRRVDGGPVVPKDA